MNRLKSEIHANYVKEKICTVLVYYNPSLSLDKLGHISPSISLSSCLSQKAETILVVVDH